MDACEHGLVVDEICQACGEPVEPDATNENAEYAGEFAPQDTVLGDWMATRRMLRTTLIWGLLALIAVTVGVLAYKTGWVIRP